LSVRIFSDAESLADAGTDLVVLRLGEGFAARGRASLALSGGRSPRGLYQRLASPPRVSQIDWSRVRVFFADERAVPPTDPESNFRMARETLIDPAHIPPRNVHRMKGEYPDLEVAVEEYEAHLSEALDLVILGLGPDGHIASLFPGSPLLGERRRRVAAVLEAPKPPPHRLTLTPLALEEARSVLVLGIGPDKAEAVARALSNEGDPAATPARLVRDREWLVDRAAAALLNGRSG
jgi:6-phosphogluconolactonase